MITDAIDHIGIAVENLDNSIDLYTNKLGFRVVHRETLPDRGIKVVFLAGSSGETTIELMEPINHDDETNTVVKFLKNRGPGLHHLAIKVSDIKQSLSELNILGIQLVDKTPRVGARGHLVAFIHPKSTIGVLIELVQVKDS
ncbi:methylmalonyl-CoA epimerase [Sulfolobus acidocaldarius]|uniref:Conserved protein n=4 Tax=Sulfolobus acidocaldarius TaxID=2285 RepID=Q4JA94_SULAC|nr:methylmalonyl-CoA epimerase [Sulfolobus acidocaldarius]AAY80286.1 conserved protein [Sulfolobus acidocaldarius DSM 639]AGE70866.1 hypothetical protein SacN8_04475 [Sulfolobus acidocaldarius N8]AGE73137.1 hypothetical protein SacRon12I_04465 [Sulfolobus acidocaldarius Ron12/I]ALU28824.1 methylmalonyl-CoA epimerase [Sulfolobus acidocaldarius]ALU31544.1 methylmalonyl-CoA epimerase [Sulfolobus acidocaldarius]